MVDTRPGAGIGARSGPLTAAETVTFSVRGTNGQCTIPADATGLAANVTVLDGTATSFLQMWPADIATAPNASTNNWTAGRQPTPNKVDLKLSPTGQIKVRNDAGTVNVLIDVVGYYEPAGVGATGPQGLQGPQGIQGPAGSSIGGIEYFNYSPATQTGSYGTTDTLIALSTLTVTAPVAGYVSYTATGNIGMAGAAVSICTVRLTGDPGPFSENIDTFSAAETHSFSRTQTFPVPAGDSSIAFYCRTTASTAAVANATFSAVYSPTRV